MKKLNIKLRIEKSIMIDEKYCEYDEDGDSGLIHYFGIVEDEDSGLLRGDV